MTVMVWESRIGTSALNNGISNVARVHPNAPQDVHAALDLPFMLGGASQFGGANGPSRGADRPIQVKLEVAIGCNSPSSQFNTATVRVWHISW